MKHLHEVFWYVSLEGGKGKKQKKHLAVFAGAIPLPLQLRFERSVKKPAAGGPDKTLWQPEERSQRHQGPQMVCHDRLDRNLREKGKSSAGTRHNS